MGAVKKLNEQESLVCQGALEAVYRSQFVLEISSDGIILSANDKFLSRTGHEMKDLKNRSLDILFPEGHLATKEYKEMWAKIKSGEDATEEFKFIGKAGRDIWISGSFSPVMDENGVVAKILCIGTDITHTRTELKVRSDIMNLTSIVSEGDLKGNIVSCNDKYVEVSQYSREELCGQGHNITRHPDMSKEVFKEMWATIGRGKIFRGKVKNKAKDGSPYYVDAVIAPILGDNGKPEKYLGVRYDITENEIEHLNMKGVLGAIDATFAYIEFDPKGNILKANEIFTNTMGYAEHEILGKHHRIFCDAELVKSVAYKEFWEKLEKGENHSGVFKRNKRSGEDVWLHAVYAPVLDDAGHLIKVIKIASNMTSHFEMIASIQETASALSSASTELTATASEMSNTAERTSKESLVASTAAEEVSGGVQTVATNIEEMVASIKEIGRSTNESSQMAKMTLEKAQESNVTVTKLGVSSQEIGDVIKVISSIAQQTNLLALNATIEAARAGDAGRGFAVVANEVKELAKQTAKATDDITNKISAIQTDTKSAIEAIAGISLSVEKLNGISGVIAAAVEEQTATTNEISRVVVQSKRGVESIAETIRHVSMAASESNTSSNQTLEASRELAHLAEKLTALTKKH